MSEKMDARTLEALKGSIAHWKRVVRAPRQTPVGSRFCQLCAVFNVAVEDRRSACKGCPVRARTRRAHCLGSPFHAFLQERNRETAQAELDFLKSLLPKGR
jgi:hypothetical protein